jgi:2-oxoglutarate ferredoxin oxidoreductase subunit alpha
VVGWGSTYGSITTAVESLQNRGVDVSSTHIRYLNPLPSNLGEILGKFDHVLVPELNRGQLALLLRAKYLVNAQSYSKVKGRPFTIHELTDRIEQLV